MAWTAITDRDICIQGKENKINCMASGTIKAGQGVVNVTSGDSSLIYVISGVANAGIPKTYLGIAAGDATKGYPVAVYTAGAVCWTRVDSGVSQSDWLFIDNDGEFDDVTDGAASEIAMSGCAIALMDQETSAGLCKVLLK